MWNLHGYFIIRDQNRSLLNQENNLLGMNYGRNYARHSMASK